ncbi:hypothetical protein ACFFQF_20880 [Haladaptatus pallidirubidus]|uniref:hypothetical protein n=2 Tax=Haladaptatus pallidirubidus TaxID=1008152 RepID=UPI0035F0A0DD
MVTNPMNYRTYSRSIPLILVALMVVFAGCAGNITIDTETTTAAPTTTTETRTTTTQDSTPTTTTTADSTVTTSTESTSTTANDGPWQTTEEESTTTADESQQTTTTHGLQSTTTTAAEEDKTTEDSEETSTKAPEPDGSTTKAPTPEPTTEPTSTSESTSTPTPETTSEPTPTSTPEETTTSTPEKSEDDYRDEFLAEIESNGITVVRYSHHTGSSFVTYDTQYLRDANAQHEEMDVIIKAFAAGVGEGWQTNRLGATIQEGYGEPLAYYHIERAWVEQYNQGEISYDELKENVDETADWLYNAPSESTTESDPTTTPEDSDNTTQ